MSRLLNLETYSYIRNNHNQFRVARQGAPLDTPGEGALVSSSSRTPIRDTGFFSGFRFSTE